MHWYFSSRLAKKVKLKNPEAGKPTDPQNNEQKTQFVTAQMVKKGGAGSYAKKYDKKQRCEVKPDVRHSEEGVGAECPLARLSAADPQAEEERSVCCGLLCD